MVIKYNRVEIAAFLLDHPADSIKTQFLATISLSLLMCGMSFCIGVTTHTMLGNVVYTLFKAHLSIQEEVDQASAIISEYNSGRVVTN